jgi:hypothetical protein
MVDAMRNVAGIPSPDVNTENTTLARIQPTFQRLEMFEVGRQRCKQIAC